MDYKICTIIVTFNRKELLLNCVEKCLGQTVKSDILIFDNHSTDGTETYLRENGIIDNKYVIYHYNPVNIGGAGGFSNGLKMAFERGYDFYWVMDDDGCPFDCFCLEKTISVYKKLDTEKVIVNALVVGPDFNTLSFHTGGYIEKHQLMSKASEEYYIGHISPFNGTLYADTAIRELGFPREDFFIKGDETEFTCRAKNRGYIVATAVEAMFIHPVMPQDIRRFLWKKIDLGEESYWKEYYKARNYVYIYSEYFSMRQLMKHVIYCLIKCAFYREDARRKRKYTLRGIRDGFRSRFINIKIN